MFSQRYLCFRSRKSTGGHKDTSIVYVKIIAHEWEREHDNEPEAECYTVLRRVLRNRFATLENAKDK